MTIAVVNGPNLNLTGKRDVAVYGHTTMEETMLDIQRTWQDIRFCYFQSNHEGALIDFLQRGTDFDAYILNAGGYSHTSIALRDTVEYLTQQHIPVIEVHISDITKREPFRQVSLLTGVCTKSIIGHGINGYKEAVEYIVALGL